MTRQTLIHVYAEIGFWLALMMVLMRVICLAACDYPRKATTSKLEEVLLIFLGMATVWVLWWALWL